MSRKLTFWLFPGEAAGILLGTTGRSGMFWSATFRALRKSVTAALNPFALMQSLL
jgi:hypothetical protein